MPLFSSRCTAVGLAALLCFVLLGCDAGGSASEASTDCDSRTGNAMRATVNGEGLCTDLGSAVLSTLAGTPRLSVVGLFENGASSISFNLDAPVVGTFDLTRSDAEHDAMYGTADETGYHADRTAGSGTVTITELSGERVKGSFEFTGVGYDISDAPTGTQAHITDGVFDFALGDFNFGF